MRNFLCPEKWPKKWQNFSEKKFNISTSIKVNPVVVTIRPSWSFYSSESWSRIRTRKTKQKRHFYKNTFSLKPHRGGNQILKSHYQELVSGAKKAKIIVWPEMSRYCLVAMAWAFTSFVIHSFRIHSAFKYSCCQPTQTWLPVISKFEKTTSRSISLPFFNQRLWNFSINFRTHSEWQNRILTLQTKKVTNWRRKSHWEQAR